MAEVASLIINADSSQVVQADKNLTKLNNTGKKTDSQLKLTSKSFRLAKNASQQLGFQIQDIAVQLQAGQSPFIVLSQQGSQLAGVLGPGGALLGAVIAIGGAMSGVLFSGLMDSTDATEDLIDTIGELTNKFEDVTEAQKVFITQTKEIERAAFEEKAAEIAKNVEQIKINMLGAAEVTALLNDEVEKGFVADAVTQFKDELVKLNAEYDTEIQKAQEVQKFIDGLGKSRVNQTKELENFIAKLKEESETYGKTALQADLYRASLLGASDVEKSMIAGFHARIQLRKDEEKALKDLTQEIKDQAKAEADAMDVKQKNLERGIALFSSYEISIKTGSDKIIASYDAQKEKVREVMQENAQLHQEGAQLIIDIEKRKQQELDALAKTQHDARVAQNKQNLQTTAGLLGDLSILMSSENKKAFKLGQNAAIASATISGISAAIEAYEWGNSISGPIAGAAAAAVSAAYTGAQIGAIKSQPAPRAQGGQMLPNNSYRVGEFGPEIVSVGGSGGFVTQDNQAGGAPVNISVNNVNNAPNSTTNAQVRQVDDRNFIIDIMTQELGDTTSKTRRIMHSTSNLKAQAS